LNERNSGNKWICLGAILLVWRSQPARPEQSPGLSFLESGRSRLADEEVDRAVSCRGPIARGHASAGTICSESDSQTRVVARRIHGCRGGDRTSGSERVSKQVGQEFHGEAEPHGD